MSIPDPPRRATLRHLFRIVGVVLSLCAGLLIAEGGLRMFHVVPTTGVSTVTEHDFARIPGLFAPHQSVLDLQNMALPFHVRINALGYRGAEFPARKPPEEFRILMLGDSYTYGQFVDESDTLPAQVEENLRGRCPRFRVVNAGVPGSTIVTQQAMLERALPLAPDLVILVFVENDVNDLLVPLWSRLATHRTTRAHFPLSIVYPYVRRTALWNLMLDVQARRIAQHTLAVVEEDTAHARAAALEDDRSDVARRQRYTDALAAMRDMLRAHQIPFVFATYPSLESVEAAENSPLLTWIHGVAAELGITSVDPAPALRATGLGRDVLYLWPYDVHPSARGNAAMASAIVRALMQDPAVVPVVEECTPTGTAAVSLEDRGSPTRPHRAPWRTVGVMRAAPHGLMPAARKGMRTG